MNVIVLTLPVKHTLLGIKEERIAVTFQLYSRLETA